MLKRPPANTFSLLYWASISSTDYTISERQTDVLTLEVDATPFLILPPTG